MVCWSVFVIILGCFLTAAGTYGSVVGIIDSYRESGVRLLSPALIIPTPRKLWECDMETQASVEKIKERC